MSLLTYPKFSVQDVSGVNLSGGRVYFYEAGTTTPKDTYSDAAFTTENDNPVILNARGEADIYINGAYKIALKDADDVEIWTQDNYSSETNSQWEDSIPSTFSTTTSFKVTGDLRTTYENGRRIKLNDASTLYGTITSSTYFAPDTTVNLALDSGVLSVSLTDSQLSILTSSNSSLPNNLKYYGKIGADVASATTLTLGEGSFFDITGTTTITSIASQGVGTTVTLQFDGALTLTHHATDLILPGAANITTAAGDIGVFYEYAAGDWRCISYASAGTPPISQLFEEGTWTPTIQDSSFSDAEGQTYSKQYGSYTKIGNRVTISFYVLASSLGTLTSADPVLIGGLPFVASSTTDSHSVVVVNAFNLSITAGHSLVGRVNPTTPRITMHIWSAATGSGNTLKFSELLTTPGFIVSGSYITDE